MSIERRLETLAQQQSYPLGALYLVGMPIGNSADISLRALHILRLADIVAAEDTRHSAQLLARYQINPRFIAVHAHNEQAQAQKIIAYLQTGVRIAYITDAGTPGISDPGARLVHSVRAAGLTIIPIPGASAVMTTLSVAGPWAYPFTFLGFLPNKVKQQHTFLQKLATHPFALVLFEAPHRIVSTVQQLALVLDAERRLFIARELTKCFETCIECALGEASAYLQQKPDYQRGEFVLVVQGALDKPTEQAQHFAQAQFFLSCLSSELPPKKAAYLVEKMTGISKDRLYQLLIHRD